MCRHAACCDFNRVLETLDRDRLTRHRSATQFSAPGYGKARRHVLLWYCSAGRIPLFAALFVIKWNAVFKMASLAPRVEGPRLERPLTAEEVELVHRLDNEDRTLWDSIRDLEEAHRAKPLRSRHAIVTILQIIKDREGLVLPLSSYIDELISQIEEWRRSEPVIWPCAGRVNA
jgi:hypothetical protein